MWIELGIPRPGVNFGKEGPPPRIWMNTDHLVRAEFTQENGILVANVITTKPGGSDRTILKGYDAERLRLALNMEVTWKPLLDFEKEQQEQAELDKKKKKASK